MKTVKLDLEHQEFLNKVKTLFEQRFGSRTIAKKLNCTRHKVQRAYRELNLDSRNVQLARKTHLITEKPCKQCKIIKPIIEFRQRIDKAGRLCIDPYCFPCSSEIHKVTSSKNYYANWDERKIYREERKDKLHEYDKKI